MQVIASASEVQEGASKAIRLVFTSVVDGASPFEPSGISAEETIFGYRSGDGTLAGGSSGKGLSMAGSSRLTLSSEDSFVRKGKV